VVFGPAWPAGVLLRRWTQRNPRNARLPWGTGIVAAIASGLGMRFLSGGPPQYGFGPHPPPNFWDHVDHIFQLSMPWAFPILVGIVVFSTQLQRARHQPERAASVPSSLATVSRFIAEGGLVIFLVAILLAARLQQYVLSQMN